MPKARPLPARLALNPAGAALGPSHQSVLDPVLPLAHVAGHTDRIRLGTATICAPFTAPALLAKTLTSLDVLSDGRLTAEAGERFAVFTPDGKALVSVQDQGIGLAPRQLDEVFEMFEQGGDQQDLAIAELVKVFELSNNRGGQP